MGFLFGGGKAVNQSAPVIASLRVQTSAYGGVIPIVFGLTRVPANLLQYEDFTAIAHVSTEGSGGKGGAPSASNTTYTYTAMVLMRLCHGIIFGVPRVWRDTSQCTLGSLGASFFSGSQSQNAFGPLLSKHPDRALAYRGLSYIAHEALDLGESAQIGNFNFELKALNPFGGLGQVIREVRLQQGAQPWNRISSALVQSSPDKSAWTTVATISPANDAAMHTYAIGASTSRPFWRLLANSNVYGWKGAWDAVTTFAANDVVTYDGDQWAGVAPVTGSHPFDDYEKLVRVDSGGEGGQDSYEYETISSGWVRLGGAGARWEVASLEFATATAGADISTLQGASSGGDWNS